MTQHNKVTDIEYLDVRHIKKSKNKVLCKAINPIMIKCCSLQATCHIIAISRYNFWSNLFPENVKSTKISAYLLFDPF